jgi:hypothetical protein
MGGKGEFISITKLDGVHPDELKRLRDRIEAIITQGSAELAIVALDPELHAGMRIILQPKEPPKKG